MHKYWNRFKEYFKSANVDNLYSFDGCVPLYKAVLFGLQHVLAMFIANLAPILLVLGTIGLSTEIQSSVI